MAIALEVETGLHLNASHACSADLMGSDLQHIGKQLEYAAPLTWGVVHTLLDVKSIAQLCREKSLQQAINYESWHIEDIDDILVNAMCGNMTNTQAEMESGEESEDTTLQHIVSSQKLLEVSEVTHLHPRKHA